MTNKFEGSDILTWIYRWVDNDTEYTDLKYQCKQLELDIEEKKYDLMNSEEYKDLKITEKKIKADYDTLTMRRELLHLEKQRDQARGYREKCEKIINYLEKGDE